MGEACLKLGRDGLPLNVDGTCVSPRYVPAGSPYLLDWVEFCEVTPKEKWPHWLATDMKHAKLDSRRKA